MIAKQIPGVTDAKEGYHHGELPATLMRLALCHIEKQGTEKLSLRALAREAGVSATAPYRHFPTKRCLLAALATQGFKELDAQTQSVVAAQANLEARFVAMGTTYVSFALKNPVAYQLMFGSILDDFSQYKMLRDASDACYLRVQTVLQELLDAKNLPYDVIQFGGVIWAGVHGVASLLLNQAHRIASSDPSHPQSVIMALRDDPEAALRIMFASLLQ